MFTRVAPLSRSLRRSVQGFVDDGVACVLFSVLFFVCFVGRGDRFLFLRFYPLAVLFFSTPLAWFGLVWIGLVWFGLVWFGLVWFGFGLVRRPHRLRKVQHLVLLCVAVAP